MNPYRLDIELLRTGVGFRQPIAWMVVLFVACAGGTHVTFAAPDAGTLKVMQFIGRDDTECSIRFRWCPAGDMKDGDPDDPAGSPKERVDGFWISETEISHKMYRVISGTANLELVKTEVLNPIFKLAGAPDDSQLNDQERDNKKERAAIEEKYWSDDSFPIYGVLPSQADSFCGDMMQSYERLRKAAGRAATFSTYQFRLPAHFEWQYACRCTTGRKHFVDWPPDPESVPFGQLPNYKEFLAKEDPKVYKEHQVPFDAFDGTEQAMVRMLEDKSLNKGKASKLRLQLLHAMLSTKDGYQSVDQAAENQWGIKGLSENVHEWVIKVSDATADRSNVPYSGDFNSTGAKCPAMTAGGWNIPKSAVWQDYSIWHWQTSKGYTRTNVAKPTFEGGIRIVMIDAVSDTWFAELRSMAEQSFDGAITPAVLEGAYESGVEVSGRDKESRNTVQGRIGIYGALAKARSGNSIAAGKLLRDSVASLGEGGDEFFQQVSAVIEDDDLRKQGSITQQ